MNLKRFKSTADVFQFLADYFFVRANEEIAKKGKFTVAVSGGSTPLPFFKALGEKKDSFNNWENVNFFWADERWVPVDNIDNNYGKAMRAGLKNLPTNFFPMNTALANPVMACNEYSETLNKVLSDQVLDVILLGAGTDGHTASIFETNLKDAQQEQVAFVTKHPQTGQQRISVTLTTLIKANEVIVILLGEEKRMILEGILHCKEPRSPIELAIFGSLRATIITDING